ncbi:MAG: DNA methyltransferase, partial [Candidatus Binatia bacterium]
MTQLSKAVHAIRRAALDSSPVGGLTHQHYKYPACFSPAFAAATIEAFSSRGDLVLDPYMGGGTT